MTCLVLNLISGFDMIDAERGVAGTRGIVDWLSLLVRQRGDLVI